MVDKLLLKKISKEPDRITELIPSEVSSILIAAKRLFEKENILLEFSELKEQDEIYILGDIHGSWKSLKKILEIIERNQPKLVISLGDIVDRGSEQLKCLIMMLSLKILEPDRFYILRGNHETREMNEYYGFFDSFIDTYGEKIYFDNVLDVYEVLPYCAIINGEILCLHGGIPENKHVISQIRELNLRKNDDLILSKIKEALFQIIWNDPKEREGYFSESFRGPGVKFFGKDAFENFMDFNNLKLLIRAHECFLEGYKWFFNERLLSIFSAANYRINMPNPGTFAIIKRGKIVVRSFSI